MPALDFIDKKYEVVIYYRQHVLEGAALNAFPPT